MNDIKETNLKVKKKFITAKWRTSKEYDEDGKKNYKY